MLGDTVFILIRLLALAWITIGLGACGDHDRADARGGDLRIVSLSPAVSRALADLNLSQIVVGRTRFCTALDPSIPVVGDHFDLNVEAMVRAGPTHVFIQPPRGVVPDALNALGATHGWRIAAWKIDTLDDIRAMVRDIVDRLDPAGESAAFADARDRAGRLDAAMGALGRDEADQSRWQGRVLLVHSVAGAIGVYGSNTYLDEVLQLLGSVNAAERVSGWGQLTLEDVVRLDPQAVVVIRPGAPAAESANEASGPISSLDIEAVRSGRVAVLRSPDALLPSTSVIDTAGELRAILDSFQDAAP
jgi:ABC-type hemin transport system substrate-binding protein